MKRLLGVILSVSAVGGWACRESAPAGASRPPFAVRIAAAADLRFALDELTAVFRQQHPEVVVSASYGSSGIFFAQLVNRAPFDLFLSADLAYPRLLAERGLTVPGSDFTYAVGRIVMWVPSSSPIDIESLGMRALADPAVLRVSMANPEHAPYGRAAASAMQTAGVYEGVKPKLVFGENVSQALQFVQSRSADVGFVALSVALSSTVRGTGRYWTVPVDTYPRLEQGGTILRWAAHAGAAQQFRSFLLGEPARVILRRYGFGAPEA